MQKWQFYLNEFEKFTHYIKMVLPQESTYDTVPFPVFFF